jgi:hypothetical protein
MQMLPVKAEHIGNHVGWSKHRNEFICHMLTHRGSHFGAVLGIKSVLLETREVQPMHAPILIEDICVTPGLGSRPYAQGAVS